MKKKTERLVILAVAIALVAAVATVAYTADLKTHVKEVGVRSGASPVAKDIVYDNTMDYSSLGSSQRDNVIPFESIMADDFEFSVLQPVNDVHWVGGYWDPYEDGFFDWEIKFYNDFGDGTKPGAAFATYRFADSEISKVEISPGFFNYSVNLPVPGVTFSPFTKYWISIQGIGDYQPQSGWGMHTAPILQHQAVFKSAYFGFPDWVDSYDVFGTIYDMAFQLTYEDPFPNQKMHFPQYPDLIGWDVNATYPKILADDWQCSQTGWVTDIHFWGSWKDQDGMPQYDDVGNILYFIFSIHANIPEDADTPYSRPGELLWMREEWVPGTPSEPPTLEAWYDPNTDSAICNDHIPYWQYDFVDIPDPFIQMKDSIYWLNISAVLVDPINFQWGWKNSRDHFMDDAVYRDEVPPFPGWQPMIEPPRCNWFDVYFDATGTPEDWGSSNYYSNGWYEYEYWWNMWFYDNPFVYRPKEIFIDRLWVAVSGSYPFAEFAINWSTPEWDTLGMGRPPLPEDGNEELYIGRQIVGPLPLETLLEYYFTIPYNPEWVSIDFVATDVIINGFIYHECVPTSMDMAFVITGEPVEEELDFGDAPDLPYPTLLANNGARHVIVPGVFLGASIDPEADGQPNAAALGDDNDGNDDEDGVVFLNLVRPGGAVTVKVTASVAGRLDGWVDFDANGSWADAGEQVFVSAPVVAGVNLLGFGVPAAAPAGITYSRFRFSTAGGLAVTGLAPDGEVEDYRVFILDPIENIKMHHPQWPDLDETGMDVDQAIYGPLGDDWMCTKTGPVNDIHFWGSYAEDILPPAGLGSQTFYVGIWSDNPGPPWSMPAVELWARSFYPGQYTVHQVADNNPEDWFDPWTGLFINNDHLQAYQFDFFIDENYFEQDSGTIYWLVIYDGEQYVYTFGWKTTRIDLQYRDDAVYWDGMNPWAPMFYPPGHEYYPETLDLAFVITGKKPVICGDVTGDGIIDLGDVLFIISYLYKGGTAPDPLCLADVNCDGTVDLGDVLHLISYLYKGGAPPCNDCCDDPAKMEKFPGQNIERILPQKSPIPQNSSGSWRFEAE